MPFKKAKKTKVVKKRTSPSPPPRAPPVETGAVDLENQVYVVEKILDARLNRKKNLRFLCKWTDWPDEYNTWEPIKHVLDCDLLIYTFFQSKKYCRRYEKLYELYQETIISKSYEMEQFDESVPDDLNTIPNKKKPQILVSKRGRLLKPPPQRFSISFDDFIGSSSSRICREPRRSRKSDDEESEKSEYDDEEEEEEDEESESEEDEENEDELLTPPPPKRASRSQTRQKLLNSSTNKKSSKNKSTTDKEPKTPIRRTSPRKRTKILESQPATELKKNEPKKIKKIAKNKTKVSKNRDLDEDNENEVEIIELDDENNIEDEEIRDAQSEGEKNNGPDEEVHVDATDNSYLEKMESILNAEFIHLDGIMLPFIPEKVLMHGGIPREIRGKEEFKQFKKSAYIVIWGERDGTIKLIFEELARKYFPTAVNIYERVGNYAAYVAEEGTFD